MPKIVRIHTPKGEKPTVEEQILFEYNDLEIGTTLVYRGKRNYNGATYTVVMIRSLARNKHGRLRVVQHAVTHNDQITIQRVEEEEALRTTTAGYIRQSAHWRKL